MALRSIIEVPGDATVKPSPGDVWYDNDHPINQGVDFRIALSEGGGVPRDLTGRHTVVLPGATTPATWTRDRGVIGLQLDDTNSGQGHIEVQRVTMSGSHTILIWVSNGKTQGGYEYLYAATNAGNQGSALYTHTGGGNKFRPYIGKVGQSVALGNFGTTDQSDGAPHLLGYMWDAVAQKLHTIGDGGIEATSSIGHAMGTWTGTAHVGALVDSQRQVELQTQQIIKYDRILSEVELKRLIVEPWTGLVAPRYVPVAAAAAAGATIPRHSINALQHGFSGHPIASLSGGLAA